MTAEREGAANEEVIVENAMVFVRRGGDDNTLKSYPVERGSPGEPVSFPPLRASDDFKIHAEFNRATYWCLVWIDTNGRAEVVASSQEREDAAEYPPGDQLVKVNPADPAGLHLLALLVSDGPVDDIQGELPTRLGDLGPPPDAPVAQFAQLRGLRGPGEVTAIDANLDPSYWPRLEDRLPEDVRWAFRLYLPTAR